MNDELISRPTFKNRLEKKESIIETKFIAQIDPRPYNFRSNLYNLFSKIFFIPSVKIYSFPGRKEIKRKKKFTVSSIHSNQKRNPPSLITIQIGPWWPRTTVSCRINIQPSSEARAKFSLCTIGPLGVHSFEWDSSRSISSAYYAIISLTSPRRGGGGRGS